MWSLRKMRWFKSWGCITSNLLFMFNKVKARHCSFADLIHTTRLPYISTKTLACPCPFTCGGHYFGKHVDFCVMVPNCPVFWIILVLIIFFELQSWNSQKNQKHKKPQTTKEDHQTPNEPNQWNANNSTHYLFPIERSARSERTMPKLSTC